MGMAAPSTCRRVEAAHRESDRAPLSLINSLWEDERLPYEAWGQPGQVKIEKTTSIESIRGR
jgi:hypothetical protein